MRKKIVATYNSSSAFRAFISQLEHNVALAWKLLSCFDHEVAERDVRSRLVRLRELCLELGERPLAQLEAEQAGQGGDPLERVLLDLFLVYQVRRVGGLRVDQGGLFAKSELVETPERHAWWLARGPSDIAYTAAVHGQHTVVGVVDPVDNNSRCVW